MTKRRWRVLAFAALALLLANAALSGALELGWARRTLLARLAASFGRPVQVRRFQFNLLNGLRLEADSVTVSEDPHFGQEYFLRADQLTAGIRWSALLRGRVEFGFVSLTRPSLNLVRLPDGSWNIESWLPPAAAPAPTANVAAGAATPAGNARLTARLSRLDVDSGRINFKLGDDKLPFALVDVSGYLAQDSLGHWSLDLAADPMRAPVPLQNAGTLHLRGSVAGTSARLRPASFQLAWVNASLADALRLLDGSDHGVRGALSGEFSATSALSTSVQSADATAQWDLVGTVRLSGVHRWDFGESPLDPAVNAAITASWRPGEPRLGIARLAIEAPRSRVNASGSLDWAHGLNPNLQLSSSTIGLSDLLAWRRAFFPGTAEDLSVGGTLTLDASMRGWPPRLQQAAISSAGAVILTQALPGPLRIGEVDAHLRGDTLTFGPASVVLPGITLKGAARNAPQPTSAGALQVAGSLGPTRPGQSPRDWRYRFSLSGDTQRAQDLVALAGAFGRPANGEWSVDGPVTLRIAWEGGLRGGTSTATGTLELHNSEFRSAALGKPLLVGAATVTLNGSERQIRLGQVQVLGTNWTGTLHRPGPGAPWDFDLSADRLDAADLDRWLEPANRPGLLDRILPFAASHNPATERDALFAHVAARGRLRVGEVLLSSLHFGKLDADAKIDGRSLVLQRAQADFYGGRVNGELDASLAAEPSYSFRGRVDRVDLGLLSDSANVLAGHFAGFATGELSLAAHGLGRQPLAASLEGEGVLRLREIMVRGIDRGADRSPDRIAERNQGKGLPPSVRTSESDPAAESRYSSAAATFHVAAGRVRIDQLLLVGRDEQFEVDGSIDFARQMNLRARALPRDGTRPAEIESQDADAWAISGSLDVPQVRPQTSVAGAPPLAAGGRR